MSEVALVKEAVIAEDKYKILSHSKPVIDAFKARNNYADARTHDPSPAHIANLRTFTGDGYKIYYLHRNADNSLDTENFNVPRVGDPEDSGFTELFMPRDGRLEDYTGTLIAPPELHRAFIFLEQKNKDGLYKDRGLIALYFPQDKVRQEKTYQCGVGLMMSLHRTTRETLFQRVVMIRDGNAVDEDCVRKILEKPLGSGCVISVPDLRDDQSELYARMIIGGETTSNAQEGRKREK